MPGEDQQPGIVTLVRQLGDDAKAFAQAEAQYLKAAANERFSYGTPAVIMIVAGLVLGAGALVALLFGIMMALAPYAGMLLSSVIVFVAGLALAALLGWGGTRRLRNAFKKPEDR